MDVAKLVESIAAQPSSEPAFVLIYTWVKAHTGAVGTALANDGLTLRSLEPMNISWNCERFVSEVDGSSHGLVLLAKWLRRLDLDLSDGASRGSIGGSSGRQYVGSDGRSYSVHERRSWALDDKLGGPVDMRLQKRAELPHVDLYGEMVQGGVMAYAWRMVAVPRDTNRAPTISEVRLGETAWRRLNAAVSRRGLSVLLWATDFDQLRTTVQSDPPFVHVRPEGLTDLDQHLESELDDAITHAVLAEATVLVLPELSASTGALRHLSEALKSCEMTPELTVIGMFHRTAPSGVSDINEVVVLDRNGDELFRHQKTAPFGSERDGSLVQERLECGTELRVLETPFGNITINICVEFFARSMEAILDESHASIVVVPSLSPKTLVHRERAKSVDAQMSAAVWCCNRAVGQGPQPEAGESFVRCGGHLYIGSKRCRAAFFYLSELRQ